MLLAEPCWLPAVLWKPATAGGRLPCSSRAVGRREAGAAGPPGRHRGTCPGLRPDT